MDARARFPLAGIGIASLGTFLVGFNGLADGITGFALFPFVTGLDSAIGGWLTLAGALVAGCLAVMLWASPAQHTFVGIAWITIATLALNTGGGFILGSLLLYVGGLLAVYHTADE